MKIPQRYRDDISDAVGDEFGWCEQEPTGQKWCIRHGCVWLHGERCDRARDVYMAAETSVEVILTSLRREVDALPTTRTRAWDKGWDSVSLGDIRALIDEATQ